MKKSLYTLNINAYAPEITALTYPLLKHYARRIGAEFVVISERRFPEWPVTYEKLQIHQLAAERGDDLSIYLDSDALVHPETVDFSVWLPPDTVAHNGTDMAAIRWKYDEFFRRDGRHIGSCNWNSWAWADCRDLWRPLDLSFAQARENIFPTVDEVVPVQMEMPGKPCPTCHLALAQARPKLDENGAPVLAPQVVDRDHLIDDYALSRNIAKYGLKATTLIELQKKMGLGNANFFWHNYVDTIPEKVRQMRELLVHWRVDAYLERLI